MKKRHTEVELSADSALAEFRGCSVYVVCGTDAILRLQPLLTLFSEQCGQSGAMQDMVYFLGKPGLMKRVPYLFLLVRTPGKKLEELTPGDLAGSLLALEYRIFRIGTRAFATSDRSGRGTLLSAPNNRIRVATQICDVLIRRGAKILMLSFAVEEPHAANLEEAAMQRFWERGQLGAQWTLRQRTYPSYLLLSETMDATLATLGQKTRSNMRYYRRRAEKELGCQPVFDLEMREAEFLSFNKESMFPVSSSVAAWRLRTLRSLTDPFLMGMKDRDGRWLSIVAGRRCQGTAEILWQFNRAGYPAHSFGTVMRSYVMEHEIAHGSKRLKVEGGTNHTMYHSFVHEEIVDMVVVRSRYKQLLERRMKRFLLADNVLAQLLKNPDVHWRQA